MKNIHRIAIDEHSRAALEEWRDYLLMKRDGWCPINYPLLARIEAAIPNAPPYFIEHYRG